MTDLIDFKYIYKEEEYSLIQRNKGICGTIFTLKTNVYILPTLAKRDKKE
jgi:hypothetical protein